MAHRDMDTAQVDQLVVLLDDIAVKTNVSSDRLAQHRQACSKCLEAVRLKPLPGPEAGPQAAEAADDELQQARALRNLSKKMFNESQRLLQYVQQARQVHTKLAAQQQSAHQQQLALQRQQQQEDQQQQQQASQQQQSKQQQQQQPSSIVGAVRSSSFSRMHSPARPRQQAPQLCVGATISPVRPHEHQSLEQLALLVEQKAQLTLQLELRDQKIAYQEAHISLLERELNTRYDGSINGSDVDDYEE